MKHHQRSQEKKHNFLLMKGPSEFFLVSISNFKHLISIFQIYFFFQGILARTSLVSLQSLSDYFDEQDGNFSCNSVSAFISKRQLKNFFRFLHIPEDPS